MEKLNIQGEPVTLPKRWSRQNFPAYMADDAAMARVETWNACLDEIAKLGPLFTRAGPAEADLDTITLCRSLVDTACNGYVQQQGHALNEIRELLQGGSCAQKNNLEDRLGHSRSANITVNGRTGDGRNDADSGVIVALRAQLAECEAMAAMIFEREWAEHVGTGQVFSKVEAAFTQLHNELHEAGEKLAERDALLDRLRNHMIAKGVLGEFGPELFQILNIEAPERAARAALSASAEPSAPVEIDERQEFESAWSARIERLRIRERGNEFYRVQPNDLYRWNNVQDAWELWQARAALERKP